MIIGCSGKAGAGKDVFGNLAVKELGAEKLAFAGGVKEEVADFFMLFNIKYNERNLYGSQADKEKTFSVVNVDKIIEIFPFFENFVDKCAERDSYFHNNITATFRSLFQWWGTEYRRAQDDNYWVKKCLDKCTDPNKVYVVTDCRFKNEANGILDLGGKVVRIERNRVTSISNMDHPSEIDLDDYDRFTVTIRNNYTLKEYEDTCESVLKRILNGDI